MSSTEAVKGSCSQYISARPYISNSSIGIMVANGRSTKEEKLKTSQAHLEKCLSSPYQPFSAYTMQHNIEPRNDKK
ncbi:hypothetical protein V496_05230 [Pseudogymnoascus sp. VKM F-4515 (FW-2607)]|nr:hypothetical protein V496_05230 [Pseudogymnoascus sp. VKM F-4515 (FW-2607)]